MVLRRGQRVNLCKNCLSEAPDNIPPIASLYLEGPYRSLSSGMNRKRFWIKAQGNGEALWTEAIFVIRRASRGGQFMLNRRSRSRFVDVCCLTRRLEGRELVRLQIKERRLGICDPIECGGLAKRACQNSAVLGGLMRSLPFRTCRRLPACANKISMLRFKRFF